MKILASVRIALRALRVNKLRSALTMLGIIIGVAAVIAMVAVGSGATALIEEQIRSIGSNIIIVQSGSVTSGGAILLAFAVSGLIGIFFGYYPARKTALLNPIEALRYEQAS